MIQRQFHAFSRPFIAVFRHHSRLVQARTSCNDRLMQDRLIVLALLAMAACLSAPAQVPQAIIDQVLPNDIEVPRLDDSSQAVFDFNGTWESVNRNVTTTVRMYQSGTTLTVKDFTPGSSYRARDVFIGTYDGQISYAGTAYPDTPSSFRISMTIRNPDNLHTSNGLDFYRTSPPKLNDIP